MSTQSSPWMKPPTVPTPVPIPQPVPWYQQIGKSGKDALWVGFVLFFISTLVIAVLASRHHRKHRAFHHVTILITAIATLTYYAMATGGGWKYVNVGWHVVQGQRTLVYRQVFWARYVNLALTAPLVLLDLALLAGLPWLDVVSALIASEFMILTGIFAALHPGRVAAKWGWYAFACLALIYVLYVLLWHGRKSAKHQHDSVSHHYTQLTLYTVVLWIVYTVIFALAEGNGIISSNAEVITYLVLDILSRAVFGFWLLIVHKHDSDTEHAVRLSDSWTEPRGARSGVIQLPGED